jgi:hypothetical protein
MQTIDFAQNLKTSSRGAGSQQRKHSNINEFSPNVQLQGYSNLSATKKIYHKSSKKDSVTTAENIMKNHENSRASIGLSPRQLLDNGNNRLFKLPAQGSFKLPALS